MKKITFLICLCLFNHFVSAQSIDAVTPAISSLADFPNTRDFALSSTGLEAYATVQIPFAEVSVIVQIKNVNEIWEEPKLLPFSGKYNDLEPFLSKNDLRLYFVSNRPISDTTEQPKDYDIWYVERENLTSEWGLPINMGPPINTSHDEFYPSVANNNNFYFTSDNPNSKGKDDIFCSVWKNNEYSEPTSLSESINTDGYEFNAYISLDETFIIFSAYNREDGLGSGDLYISFRDENQAWSKAVNLGNKINSKQMDYCPYIDSKSMTLYFTSKRSAYKKGYDFQSIKEVVEEINKDENGLSKVYRVAFDEVLLLKNK